MDDSITEFEKWVVSSDGLGLPISIDVQQGIVSLPQWEFVLLVKEYRSYKYSMWFYLFVVFVLLVMIVLQAFFLH